MASKRCAMRACSQARSRGSSDIRCSGASGLSGLWVRNGLQIKGQAMSYIQCHFGNSMVDADIYLLQVCATQLDHHIILPTIFQR